MSHRASGYTLLELMAVGAILAVVVLIGLPDLWRYSSAQRLAHASYELQAILRRAQGRAIRDGIKVGVKFYPEGGQVYFALYEDGDGDGVLTRDIRSGQDPQLTPRRKIRHLGGDIRFGFPPGRPPRDPGNYHRRLSRLDDPVRFNRSDLAVFGPLGGSTPGTLYITDGRHLRAVRVFGRTGKIKILLYDAKSERWSQV